jgi:hypothetical protein
MDLSSLGWLHPLIDAAGREKQLGMFGDGGKRREILRAARNNGADLRTTMLVASSEAQNDQGHVVVLCGAGCELIGYLHDAGNDFQGVAALWGAHRGAQAFFSPFL